MNKKKAILIVGTILFISISLISNLKNNSFYNKNLIINPIYYSIFGFLVLLLFFVLAFKKENKKPLNNEISNLLKKINKKKTKQINIKKDPEKLSPEVEQTIPEDPDIKEEITKEETEEDNEVFKKDEEKLIDEVKKEAEEDIKKTKKSKFHK